MKQRNSKALTGCGSAWLERLIWDQEVAGSNPVTPTISGCSSMVELQPSKLITWVRFPSPAFMSLQLSWIEQRPSKPWVGGSNPFRLVFYIWWVQRSWLARQIVALEAVGSNPRTLIVVRDMILERSRIMSLF